MMILPMTSYNICSRGYKTNQANYPSLPTISFLGKNELIPPTNPNLQTYLGEKNVMVLDRIRKIGENHNVETYLFGGSVRDVLMGKKANDLDILVNCDSLEFSQHMEKEYGESFTKKKYEPHVKKVTLVTKSGTEIDIIPITKDGSRANSRKEIKEALAENITRRDYSINTMLIKLGSKKDGRLNLKFIDIKKARTDLKDNVLRVVNKDYFMKNPVQVVRGIRLKTKYGMDVEEKTQDVIRECIENHKGNKTDRYYYRLFKEFYKVFKSAGPRNAISEIIKSKSYKLIA